MSGVTSHCTGEQPGFGTMIENALSTFVGEPVRGGWKPVYTLYRFGVAVITDWICPVCDRLTCMSRTCPHCGLAVMEIPTMPAKSSRASRSDYAEWIREEIGAGLGANKEGTGQANSAL